MTKEKKRLDGKARRIAAKHGCAIKKSRKAESLDNLGGYMLVDVSTNGVISGRRFDLTAQDVIDYFES